VRPGARPRASREGRRRASVPRARPGDGDVHRGAHRRPIVRGDGEYLAPSRGGDVLIPGERRRRGAKGRAFGEHGEARVADGSVEECEGGVDIARLAEDACAHEECLAVAHGARVAEFRARGGGDADEGRDVAGLDEHGAHRPCDVLGVVGQAVELHGALLLLDVDVVAGVGGEEGLEVLDVAGLAVGGGLEGADQLGAHVVLAVVERERVEDRVVRGALRAHGLAQLATLVEAAEATEDDALEHAADLERGVLAQQIAVDGLERTLVVAGVDQLVDGLELAHHAHGVHGGRGPARRLTHREREEGKTTRTTSPNVSVARAQPRYERGGDPRAPKYETSAERALTNDVRSRRLNPPPSQEEARRDAHGEGAFSVSFRRGARRRQN